MFGGDGGNPVDSGGNALHTFDFTTHTWSQPEVTGAALLTHRSSFLATCHKGGLVVMGGRFLHCYNCAGNIMCVPNMEACDICSLQLVR